MKNYKEWLRDNIEDIDETLNDYMDEFRGDLEDLDMIEFIADKVRDILSESFNDESVTEFYEIIKREVIQGYVNYMFKNWYTGELTEEDYYLGILEIV